MSIFFKTAYGTFEGVKKSIKNILKAADKEGQ